MSIYSIIENTRKWPGLYLGSKSITALSHFLNGYQIAERDLAVGRNGEIFPLSFQYMHDYTTYRLKNPHSSMGWCDQILRYCDGDEEAALWKFFELYDGFIRVRMRRYWKAVLSEDNIAWNNQMEHAYTTVGGAPHLDGQYTVFGEVIEGMDVIDKIEKVETDAADRPVEDVRIISMEIVK